MIDALERSKNSSGGTVYQPLWGETDTLDQHRIGINFGLGHDNVEKCQTVFFWEGPRATEGGVLCRIGWRGGYGVGKNNFTILHLTSHCEPRGYPLD